MMDALIKIQTTISGYEGAPVTLYSAYGTEAKALAISKLSPLYPKRREGCIVITNLLDIPRDMLFTEDMLGDAILAYYNLSKGLAADNKSAALTFEQTCHLANPITSVQRDKFDISGQRFIIESSITNAQIAALATCLYASQAATIDSTVEFIDEIDQLVHGNIVTI